MLLSLPSDAELSRQRSFQVLKNYICAGEQIISDECGGALDARVLLADQRQLTGFRRIQRRPVRDEVSMHQALVLGWTSRLQLGLVDYEGRDELLGYANAWAPVHAYYAVYGSVRALLSGRGLAANDHTAALNAISTEATKSSMVMPPPFRAACTGCPHVDDPVRFIGLPSGVSHDPKVQLLGRHLPELAWPRYLKALETTREQVLERRYREWCRQRGRKVTRRAEKASIASHASPTTLFDVFWRLRVRANYRDAASFVMVTIDADWHREFYDALVALTEVSCLVVENTLIQHIGLPSYLTVANEFARWTPTSGASDFIRKRIELLSDRST